MTIKHYAKDPKNQDEARVRGALLADYMNEKMGGKWKVRVWENFGWNYEVHIGSISVYYHAPAKQFLTMIDSTKGKAGKGHADWSSRNEHQKPEVSVKIAMAEMEKIVLGHADVMNANRRAIGLPLYTIKPYSAGTTSGSKKRPGQRIPSKKSNRRSIGK